MKQENYIFKFDNKEVKEVDCRFLIDKSANSELNSCNLMLFNVDEASKNIIKVAKKLEVEVLDNRKLTKSNLFGGDIIAIKGDAKLGMDNLLISAFDGRELLKKMVSLAMPSGTRLSLLVNRLANNQIEGGRFILPKALREYKFSTAISYCGSLQGMLGFLNDNFAIRWKIIDDDVYLFQDDGKDFQSVDNSDLDKIFRKIQQVSYFKEFKMIESKESYGLRLDEHYVIQPLQSIRLRSKYSNGIEKYIASSVKHRGQTVANNYSQGGRANFFLPEGQITATEIGFFLAG